MPNFNLHMILVSGVPDDNEEDCEFTQAYKKARELFDEDLVPPLTSVGHNSMQSFCVYPSFSGFGREAQILHLKNVDLFCDFLTKTHMDWFVVNVKEYAGEKPTIYRWSEDIIDLSEV